jgi:flagellar operon protein
MPEINGINVPFIPVRGVEELKSIPPKARTVGNAIDFKDIFSEELSKLKFSGHAQTRMISRDISLDDNQLQRLEQAIDKLAEKQGNNSLVLMDDTAFIVNVPNRTVITLFDKSQIQENVITNIDSAGFA